MKKEEINRDIKYIKNNNKYEYTCPFCGYVHKVDDEFYIYHFLEKKENIQDRCFHCDEILFMEYQKAV